MDINDIKGIIPPVITPLLENETVDEISLRNIIDRCIHCRMNGIFVTGSGGETMSLLPEQKLKAIKIALDEVGGRIPVLCGVIDTSTKRVVENIKAIEQMGGEIAVVTPPFYIKNSCQNEIIRHFEIIARETNVNIMVYNIPGNTQVNILPETIEKISEIDRIIGVKESSGNWIQFQKYAFLLKDKKFIIFQGLPELAAVSFLIGADGLTPLYSILMPNIYKGLYHAAVDRNVKRTFEYQKIISSFNDINKLAISPVSIQKFSVSLLGLSGKKATTPCEPLTESEEKVIGDFVRQYLQLDAKITVNNMQINSENAEAV